MVQRSEDSRPGEQLPVSRWDGWGGGGAYLYPGGMGEEEEGGAYLYPGGMGEEEGGAYLYPGGMGEEEGGGLTWAAVHLMSSPCLNIYMKVEYIDKNIHCEREMMYQCLHIYMI